MDLDSVIRWLRWCPAYPSVAWRTSPFWAISTECWSRKCPYTFIAKAPPSLWPSQRETVGISTPDSMQVVAKQMAQIMLADVRNPQSSCRHFSTNRCIWKRYMILASADWFGRCSLQSFEQLAHVRDHRDRSRCPVLRACDFVARAPGSGLFEITISPSDILRLAFAKSSISQKLDQVGRVVAEPPVDLADALTISRNWKRLGN